jgi:hypothetical protein
MVAAQVFPGNSAMDLMITECVSVVKGGMAVASVKNTGRFFIPSAGVGSMRWAAVSVLQTALKARRI